MFPERQQGPHKDWKQEVEYLDNIFKNGAAYTIGKVNGDHWLLYITGDDLLSESIHSVHSPSEDRHPDFTIEILMSDLSADAREPFMFAETSHDSPSDLGREVSDKIGISNIFPPSLTTLDAYAFQPCGYSSNALVKWGHEHLEHEAKYPDVPPKIGHSGEGYYTIHVTPEQGWSYASFECNVPLSTSKVEDAAKIPDLQSLIQRVVGIFKPGRITLTLFISSEDNDTTGETPVELAQRTFKTTLTGSTLDFGEHDGRPLVYRRTDKINYEFGGYDLAFASFELR